jgi:hypothetical protein
MPNNTPITIPIAYRITDRSEYANLKITGKIGIELKIKTKKNI